MSTATVTAKGQITIPKRVREALGLRVGDQVVFLLEDGKAYLHPISRRDIKELYGVFAGRRPFPGRDVEREAARSRAAAEALGVREPAA